MRRFFFHFTIGLITFALGVGAMFLVMTASQGQSTEITSISEVNQGTESATIPAIELEPRKIEPLEISKTVNDWPTDYLPIDPVIERWGKDLPLEETRISLKTMKPIRGGESPLETARPELVDLNRDGNKELFVYHACAGNGNCDVEGFFKTGAHCRRILSAYMVQHIDVLSSSTKGFSDIETFTHDSATNSYRQKFEWNGREYRPKSCRWVDYSHSDKKGNLVESQLPKVTYRRCGDYD
jgi:hypothetical protein